MELKIGDLVTRNKYNNDIVFIITDIENETYYLKGQNNRLYADSTKDDLKRYNGEVEDKEFIERLLPILENRDEYFYIPGKILHIDGDEDYLNRCLKYYEDMSIKAIGVKEKEENIANRIKSLIELYKPNIIVITGHDAYYKKKGIKDDINNYKNSKYFVEAIKEARNIISSHDKLIIIAGACQSDYEELIKAGANFASSPRRVNIHALDPAIIAASISLTEVSRDIDLKKILEKTRYGASGIGGIITKGCMYVGYPRI